MPAAVFADQGVPVWSEDHAAAAPGAREALCDGILEAAGRHGGVGIDDLIRLQPAIQHGQRAPGAGVVQIVGQAVLKGLTLFQWSSSAVWLSQYQASAMTSWSLLM